MNTTTDVGHARNVNNFQALLEVCTSLGASYNPARDGLKLPAMQETLKSAQEAIGHHRELAAHLRAEVASRKAKFAEFETRITRIHQTLRACGCGPEVEEKVNQIVRVVRGKRSSAPALAAPARSEVEVGTALTDVAPMPKMRSVGHVSFEIRVENLDILLSTLSAVPGYMAYEDELKLEGIQAWRDQLRQSNQAVRAAELAWDGSRAERDRILYGEVTGVCDRASDCKAYLRGVFGGASSQNRQVAGLVFIKKN